MSHFYHLSHIDLDGYGCQYLTCHCFEHIECYNENYGPEVQARLEEIISQIHLSKTSGNKEDSIILITDLNLTTKEGNWIENEAMRVGAKLQLLDHHASGIQASERFAWYKLDTTRSATLITYDWLQKQYNFDSEKNFTDIVQAINAIDIWVSDDTYFEFGKVCLGMISGAKEINRILFPQEDRKFKLGLIQKAHTLVKEKEGNILLDDALHQTKKTFFSLGKNDTKDNLVADYVTKLLTIDKERLTIEYKGYKGLLGYNVGSSSLIGNAFLVANPDYDFYMDINYRGQFSLRGINKMDLSKMAAEIGNGGGHPNASGGKIENYKDSFVYENIRQFVQNHINESAQK